MAKDFDIEGQLNFFDMMGAYTDDIGATVRVSKPRSKVKNRGEEESRITISSPQPFDNKPVQLKFSLEISDVKDDSSKDTEICDLAVKVSEGQEECKNDASENETVESEAEWEKGAIETEITECEIEATAIDASDDMECEKTEEEPETEVIKESAAEISEESEEAEKEPTAPKVNNEQLFEKCCNCWCYDCKHNSRNEGKPREMCGVMMACPACNSCIEQDYAEICIIGSAKEGCKTRAMEEGITPQDYEE